MSIEDPAAVKARAEARFKVAAEKKQQADDAMAQERARQQAVLDRTGKLKAQRLAKEEAERADDKPKRARRS